MAIEGTHIIDAHHHVGSVRAVERGTGHTEGQTSVEEHAERELATRLDIMDGLGVDQAIVIPGHGYLRPMGNADTIRENDAIAAYRDRSPDRFPAALGVVEPLHGLASFAELRRIKDELGLVGASIHARFQGVATNSEYVLALAREMSHLELFPYVHAAAGSLDEAWWKVQDFADSIPDVPVLALDAFTSSERAAEAVRVAVKTPNLYFDTSVCSGLNLILPVMDAVGPERIVFGTNQYSLVTATRPSSRRNILDQLVTSPLINPEARRLILGGNIQRLLALGAS